jgi:hypothetical protein
LPPFDGQPLWGWCVRFVALRPAARSSPQIFHSSRYRSYQNYDSLN